MTRPHRSSFGILVVGLSLLSSLVAGCGDKTALPPPWRSGGSTAVAESGTGGDVQSTATLPGGGGAGGYGVGGAGLGTGGAGGGGAVLGTGGVGVGGVGSGATGGTSFGAGGAIGGGGGVSLGTGGAGTGGSAPASGGTGGGPAGCRYPSCLWNLVKDCLVTGQCTRDDPGVGGSQSRLCCSNGVTQVVTMETLPSDLIVGTVSVVRDDRSCYTVNVNGRTTPSGDIAATYTWFDPSGQAAVKGVLTNPDFVTLTCPDGESVDFDTDCAPDGSDEATITDGTCN